MINKICIIGHPSYLGGADTELDHQIRCWQSLGITVHIIHTSNIDNNLKSMRMQERGCIVHQPQDWKAAKGMPVISYCNGTFLANIEEIHSYASTIIWVNCMTWLFKAEEEAHRKGLIDHFIYQTKHTRQRVQPRLAQINPNFKYTEIKPYFHQKDFPFINTRDESTFKFGRISREDRDKYHQATYWIYESMVAPVLKEGILLGVNDKIRDKIGKEPNWIKCYPANGITTQEFYKHSKYIIQASETYENLPRIGFEAMASGSLLIVDNRGGWRDLILHKQTGYLCNDPKEFVYYASRAAYESEETRQMISNAKLWLEKNWGLEQAQMEWSKFFMKL